MNLSMASEVRSALAWGPPKIFSAPWPIRAEVSSVSMTSAEDARFSAPRFHPASEWMNSAAEELSIRLLVNKVVITSTNYRARLQAFRKSSQVRTSHVHQRLAISGEIVGIIPLGCVRYAAT